MRSAGLFAPVMDDPPAGPLRRILALRPHERRLVLAALPVLLLARVGLRLLPLPRLQRLLARLADATPAPQAHTDYAERAGRAVACVAALLPGTGAAAAALATLTLMRRRGLTGRLRQGVRPTAAGLARHTWVEHNGRIVAGGPAALVAQFTPLPAAPGDTL